MTRKHLPNKLPYNDYSGKMPDLNFCYDEEVIIDSNELPDPQIDPLIPGAAVPLRKVGIAPIDLPIRVPRRDGSTQTLQTQASLYASLDSPAAKGLNLSRFYLLMHDAIADHLTNDGIKAALKAAAEKQGASKAWCKLRFKYPWTQRSLRSGLEGHIAYDCELEGVYTRVTKPHPWNEPGRCRDDWTVTEDDYKFYLTVKYVYSSTCPCSFELAYDARTKRKAAANAHSQRSVATIKIQYDPDNMIWIEDVVEMARQEIPTEVQVVVKRVDEQAFAELNGSNLLFSEDACRILYARLDQWYAEGKIKDYSIAVEHIESLHPWSAIAITSKFDDEGHLK